MGTALFPTKISVTLYPSPPFWLGERKSVRKYLSDYLSQIRQCCHIAKEIGGISSNHCVYGIIHPILILSVRPGLSWMVTVPVGLRAIEIAYRK